MKNSEIIVNRNEEGTRKADISALAEMFDSGFVDTSLPNGVVFVLPDEVEARYLKLRTKPNKADWALHELAKEKLANGDYKDEDEKTTLEHQAADVNNCIPESYQILAADVITKNGFWLSKNYLMRMAKINPTDDKSIAVDDITLYGVGNAQERYDQMKGVPIKVNGVKKMWTTWDGKAQERRFQILEFENPETALPSINAVRKAQGKSEYAAA